MKWLKSFKLNVQGLSEYLWYGNTLSNQTLIQKLIKFTPGTSTEINLSTFKNQKKTYWTITSDESRKNHDSFETAVVKTRTS